MTEQPNREVAVLNAALELPPAERAAYLDRACASDSALRKQVEALLQAHDQAESFMDAPPAGLDFQRTVKVNIPLTEKPGDRIGRYKLLQQIGEGGCGVVYMAEMLGLAIALWQSIEKTRAYNRAVAAERNAQDEAARSQQVAQFLKDMLAGAGPEVANGRDATILLEILDKTAKRIGQELTNQPAVEETISATIGRLYIDLGQYKRA